MEATKARESGHAGDKKTLKKKLFLVHVDIFRFSIQTAERGLVSVFLYILPNQVYNLIFN